MNKKELIAAVAEKTDLSKKDADAAVSAVLGAITDALKAGDKDVYKRQKIHGRKG